MISNNISAITKLAEQTYNKWSVFDETIGIKYSSFGRIHDQNKFFWIRIPKCANTFIQWHTTSMREIDYYADYSKITSPKYKGFVVLRDPLERWISGATTFFRTENVKEDFNSDESLNFFKDALQFKNFYTSVFIDYTIDRLSKNYHGLLQVWHLYPVLIQNIDFFYLNNKLGYQLNHCLTSHSVGNTMNNIKMNETGIEDPIYNFINTFVMDPVNAKYKQKILDFLKPDYELLSLLNYKTK